MKCFRFVDYLNNFSEINYLICTFAGMLIIMLDFINIFQLATIMRNTSELIECGTYIVCSLFAIYINFYIGQMLINHSQAAFTELCQVPFYMLSLETQKLLLFVIARSRKQCVLSIGGIFVSSHEVFLELMQKAFSFAMVYYSVR
ncbi:uncharacterized protein LOC122633785 [Vespula pensylvanica]|uniref:uncharacterized protein LOC122633785 n=1 Tax=Vespula pensylvanica TaxID=30213 RepID=UPI001CB9EB07|nr:uncharacterized protein LOC122633785 [Vespula pensylvanica]